MRRLAFTTMYTPSSFAALVIVGVEVGVLRGVKDSIVMTIEDRPCSIPIVLYSLGVMWRGGGAVMSSLMRICACRVIGFWSSNGN